jgi:hypothetical protein
VWRLALLVLVSFLILACREDGAGGDASSLAPAAKSSVTASMTPSATATATAEPTPLPEPDVRFHFFGVDQADQALIRAGVEYAQNHLRDAAGVQVWKADVFAGSDVDRLTEDFIEFFAMAGFRAAGFRQRIATGSAEAHPGSVWIYTRAPLWQQANSVQRVRTVAHEFAHLLQLQVMGEDLTERFYTREATAPQLEGPSWLLEGTADLVSWRSMEAGGLTTLADHLDEIAARLAGSDLHPRDMEAYIDYLGGRADSIDVALLAAELLMRDEDAGALVRYFERIRAGEAWQEAFAEAFGETPQAFYLRFDAYRQSGFRRP